MTWGGRRAMKARAYCQSVYGFTCWLCGHEIAADDYDVDHVEPRSVAPHLTWEPSNWRPSHARRHPEFNCPGNRGRATTGEPEPVSAWTAPGW